MQKINPLLDQTSRELKSDSNASLTEVGQSRDTTDYAATSPRDIAEPGVAYSASSEDSEDATAQMDHVDAINQAFAEFEFAYHNQFHKAFSDAESLVIAKKYWLSSLDNYAPRQIVLAAKKVIKTQDYLPSIAALVRACEEGLDLFGLPSPRQAYLEACRAAAPKRLQNWSHPAVYLAGVGAGWYLLANEAEASALPVYEYHYGILCKQVLSGEELGIIAPAALPEKTSRKLSKEETRARIAKMRSDLGL
jgi:hypothetical protein